MGYREESTIPLLKTAGVVLLSLLAGPATERVVNQRLRLYVNVFF